MCFIPVRTTTRTIRYIKYVCAERHRKTKVCRFLFIDPLSLKKSISKSITCRFLILRIQLSKNYIVFPIILCISISKNFQNINISIIYKLPRVFSKSSSENFVYHNCNLTFCSHVARIGEVNDITPNERCGLFQQKRKQVIVSRST